MQQMYNLSDKVVVMELEQLPMNDVQRSIEVQNKMSDTIEKRAAKTYWNIRVVASKQKLKDGTTPELRRNIYIGRKSYCAKLVHCKKLDEFHPKWKLAAALYSETTVELSPSNLVKAFSFAESAEENIYCCPNRIAALASKPLTGMLINENKKKTNCLQSQI